MTRDDIIRMAREVQIIDPSDPDDGAVVAETVDILTRFHNLAVIAEREACAALCESTSWTDDIEQWRDMTKRDVSARSMLECAAAIRARSQP